MKNYLLQWFRHFASPAFLVMLFAAFVLWYIAKLSYNYTTDLDVTIKVAGQEFEVECVVEGVGTNLFGYHLYKGGDTSIKLPDIKYVRSEEIGREDYITIDPQSLQNAISVTYSDIKIISIGTYPQVKLSPEDEILYRNK